MRYSKYIFAAFLLFTGSISNDKTDHNPRYINGIEDRIDRVIGNLQVKSDIDGVYESKGLNERLKFYHTPGVSIAVINDGKLEWAKGFGIRNNISNDPVDASTMFMAGSVSKPIFALAVMRLKEKGIVDLDKDVNEYLKSWKVPPVNEWQPKISLRQLLSHTAGMTVGGFEGYLRTDPVPTLPQILNGEPPANSPPVKVNILPGIEMRYSGGGTTVAQLTIMDILGKSFPEILHKELFEPLNLKYSTYEQPLPERLQNNYSIGFPNNSVPIIGGFHVYPEMAAAGLWTTPKELSMLLIEIQNGLKGQSDVFKKETMEEMLTPQKISPVVGIGFFLQGENESIRFFHSGWDEGFVSTAIAYANKGLGAVVMVNSNEGFAMIDEIISSIAIEYKWPDIFSPNKYNNVINETEAKELTGKYYDNENNELGINYSANNLYLVYQNQQPLEISKTQDDKFRNELFNFTISISNDTLHLVQEQTSKLYIRRN
ncbi:MAG: serine hydrolase domain-containing protein [Ignavibacteria bacterium]